MAGPQTREKLQPRSTKAIQNRLPNYSGRFDYDLGDPKAAPYSPNLGNEITQPYPLMEQDNRGVMGAMANNPMIQQAKNLYNKIDPWIPDLDVGGNNLGYSFERPLLGGTLGFGMDYGWDDEDIGAFLNWKMGLGA